MGAHHSVASATGAMMCCICSNSNSALSSSRWANGIDLGVLMQKGLASAVSKMWNSLHINILMLPSKTVGYSRFKSCNVGIGPDATVVLRILGSEGAGTGGGRG